MDGQVFLGHHCLLLGIDLDAATLCHLLELLRLRIDIHGRHRHLLGVDGGLACSLSFVVCGREAHLLGPDGEDAVLGQSRLFHLVAVELRLHAADLHLLREEQNLALGLVGGLRHLALVVGLHVGGVDVRQSDALRPDGDAAVLCEAGVLIFLVGHLGVDGLHGDVLRGDDHVALCWQLGSFQRAVFFLLHARPSGGAQVDGLHVHGESVALVERALVVEDALHLHAVGEDGHARTLVGTEVAVAVGIYDAQVFRLYGHRTLYGLFLEVVVGGLAHLLLHLREELLLPVQFCQFTQALRLSVEIGDQLWRQVADQDVEFVNVVIAARQLVLVYQSQLVAFVVELRQFLTLLLKVVQILLGLLL